MSDPVTNVEIEDVLSSIRRLVSDGDKARTRDPAPVEVDAAPVQNAPEAPAETSESKPDKFVLTPALLVVDNNASSEDAAEVDNNAHDENAHDEDEWVEEIEETSASNPETENDADEGPLPLTDMVWDSVNEARKAGIAAVPVEGGDSEDVVQTPDRSELVATIAELEAAVSNEIEDFEPDGSEDAGDLMGETIAWPGAVARKFDDVQDAEEATAPAPEFNPDLETDDAPIEFEHRKAGVEPEQVSDADTGAAPEMATNDSTQDEYGDDDLDGLLEAGGVSLDEEALRALVSEVVREELTGPLGERITRNVRKLVRREIYRILSSQEFD